MSFNDLEDKPVIPPLHSVKGKGTLQIDGADDVAADFIFEQHHDGTLRLVCTVPIGVALANLHHGGYGGDSDERRFSGLTSENWQLELPKLMLDKHGTHEGAGYAEFLGFEATLTPLDEAGQQREGQPHFLQVPLVNCQFSPTVMSHTFANGFRIDGQQVPLKIDGRELTLCYRWPTVFETDKTLKKHRVACVLSDAFMPVTGWPNHHDLKEMLAVLCSLLTFTEDARINWLGYDVYNSKGEVLHRFCIHTATSAYRGDLAGREWSACPWIPSLPLFIETAYTRYQQLWDDWDIYALITLFTELRGQQQFLEVTGLHLCSCAEILNTAYKNRVGKREFRQSLREICAAVGFTVEEKDLQRFTDNRNALVHEGLFAISDALVDPKKLRPRDRWDWYDRKARERFRELNFMYDFIGTLIFCALGGNKKLIGH